MELNLQSSLQDQKDQESTDEQTIATLRAELSRIFSLQDLHKYPEVVAAMNLQFSIHLSHLFYSSSIEAIVGTNYALFLEEVKKLSEEGVLEMAENSVRLPLPPMKKTGIGLKSFKGSESELKDFLKQHQQNSSVTIVKLGQLYNLSFLSESQLESFTSWLKEKGHKVQVYSESLAKVYYKIQSQCQKENPKPQKLAYYPPSHNYSSQNYQFQDKTYQPKQTYQQKSDQYQESQEEPSWQRGGGGWRGNRGGGGAGGGGRGRYVRGGRAGFVKRPRFDSQNFPGLQTGAQSQVDKNIRRYEITEIFEIFRHTTAGCPKIFDDLRALPQVNGINLFQQKPYDSLALLQEPAQALVKREKLRRMSMNNQELDTPQSYSYLKKATVLTGNHFKLRSRAQSQTFGEGGEPIPKQIQKIIEEQTGELPTEKKGESNRQRLFTMG